MKLLVCGGRDYNNREHVFCSLDLAHAKRPVTIVIQGGAKGRGGKKSADELAAEWARSRLIHCAQVDAIWQPNGILDRGAGPKRNRAMLLLIPDGVVAFPGGRGTADMVGAARDQGLKVWEPKP